jgi:hypothetical protein
MRFLRRTLYYMWTAPHFYFYHNCSCRSLQLRLPSLVILSVGYKKHLFSLGGGFFLLLSFESGNQICSGVPCFYTINHHRANLCLTILCVIHLVIQNQSSVFCSRRVNVCVRSLIIRGWSAVRVDALGSHSSTPTHWHPLLTDKPYSIYYAQGLRPWYWLCGMRLSKWAFEIPSSLVQNQFSLGKYTDFFPLATYCRFRTTYFNNNSNIIIIIIIIAIRIIILIFILQLLSWLFFLILWLFT